MLLKKHCEKWDVIKAIESSPPLNYTFIHSCNKSFLNASIISGTVLYRGNTNMSLKKKHRVDVGSRLNISNQVTAEVLLYEQRFIWSKW